MPTLASARRRSGRGLPPAERSASSGAVGGFGRVRDARENERVLVGGDRSLGEHLRAREITHPGRPLRLAADLLGVGERFGGEAARSARLERLADAVGFGHGRGSRRARAADASPASGYDASRAVRFIAPPWRPLPRRRSWGFGRLSRARSRYGRKETRVGRQFFELGLGASAPCDRFFEQRARPFGPKPGFGRGVFERTCIGLHRDGAHQSRAVSAHSRASPSSSSAWRTSPDRRAPGRPFESVACFLERARVSACIDAVAPRGHRGQDLLGHALESRNRLGESRCRRAEPPAPTQRSPNQPAPATRDFASRRGPSHGGRTWSSVALRQTEP